MSEHSNRETRRLDTWKEIASHLRVTERTAQEWERNHRLPVHRMGSGPRARVWAKTAEIDAWMESPPPDIRREKRSTMKRPSQMWFLAIISSSLLAAAAILVFSVFRSNALACAPVRGEVEGVTLKVFDERDRVCWTRSFEDLSVGTYQEGRTQVQLSVADFDAGTKENEVLFLAISNQGGCTVPKLLLFTASGEIMWYADLGEPVPLKDRPFQVCFDASLRVFGETRGTQLVLVLVEQSPFFPMRLVVYDSSGKMHGDYWHPGRVSGQAVALGPGGPDGGRLLWVGGDNNPGEGLGHPFAAVIGFPFPNGPLTGGEDARRHFFGPRYAIEEAYFFFPRIDVYTAQSQRTKVDHIAVGGRWGQIAVGRPEGVVYFLINSKFEILSCNISDQLRAAHQRAFLLGSLDHHLTAEEEAAWCRAWRAPTAIDGNMPGLEEALPQVPWADQRTGSGE